MGRQVKITMAALAVAVGLFSAGCGSGDPYANEQTPAPKKPDVSAADHAKNVQNANIPESAKKVLMGSINQNGQQDK